MKREIQSLLSGNYSPHLFGCHMYLTVVPSRTMGWVSVLGGFSLQPVVFHFTLPGLLRMVVFVSILSHGWILICCLIFKLKDSRDQAAVNQPCVCVCVFAGRYYSKEGSILFLISLNRWGFGRKYFNKIELWLIISLFLSTAVKSEGYE